MGVPTGVLAQGPSFSARTACFNTFPQSIRNECAADGRRVARSGPPLLHMPFASRHMASPLYISLGWKVSSQDPDANDHVLLNARCKLSNGLTFVGDCMAHLVRCMESVLHSALSITMATEAVGTPQGYHFGNPRGNPSLLGVTRYPSLTLG